MRARALLLTLPLVAACSADAPAPAPTAVYVGTATPSPATNSDPAQNLLVAVAVGCDQLEFFLCGDEQVHTTSAYPSATELTSDGENGSFKTGGYYPGEGQFDSATAKGTIALDDDNGRTFTWQAERVASDSPTGPGLYSDGDACATRFIVGPSDMPWNGPTYDGHPRLGSGCTTDVDNPREQVEPMQTLDTGYLLEIRSIARQVQVERVTLCNEP